MPTDKLRHVDRRTVLKGAGGIAVAGVIAGCNDEEVEPEPDPDTQAVDPAGAR